MQGLLLPICSIIFSILLCICFFIKKRLPLLENNMYSIMIITVLIDSILVTILQSFSFNTITPTIDIIIQILNKFDFILLIIYMSSLFLYIAIITYQKIRDNSESIIQYVAIVDIIFSIFILLGNISVISSNGHFSVDGSSIKFLVLAVSFYIMLSLTVMILNPKKIDKRYIPLISVIISIILLIIISHFNPYLIIISISLTFINYIMFFTIENPDMRMIQQLELAKEKAEQASRAKTDFLSSMSHEIRTPLNAIVGFSDCIMDAKSLDEAKENAKDIINASDTLLEIVNGILDISKIEAGKVEIIDSKYNAKKLFEGLAKMIEIKARDKGLEFTYKIADDLPKTLYGDHANLKKVITNLLSNACKYTEKGYVHYEVNCVNAEKATKLIISVEDSGRGIKKENIDKMFTKFQRLDEDKNTTIEGTGLGLAITKQLIELMGGKIIVHTVYGEGSKFTVVINQTIKNEEQEKNDQVQSTLDLYNIKILIVDDTPLNLKVAKKLLEKFNANMITTCESGYECISKIKNKDKFDIILLDDMMPKMSGVETLKKLKEIDDFNTPVIALTANAISGMREKYISDGFSDYLAKPIEKDQLIEVLNRIIKENFIQHDTKDNIEENNIIPPSPIKIDHIEPIEILSNEIETIPVVQLEEKSSEKYDENYLRKNGVDMNHALELLGDMEMYNMTIQDFSKEIDEKWNNILKYKNENNMSEYAILVHSLKSDCKYLGFMTLADISYQHELKSKENDSNYVQEHFQELESEYQKTLEIVRNYVSQNPINE